MTAKQTIPIHDTKRRKTTHSIDTMALIHSDIIDGTLLDLTHPDDLEMLSRTIDRYYSRMVGTYE